ncbi:MAG TPA: hypothetical protein VLS28_10585, partial [Candidatus Sulfomarinibacteraceae bacterium]|nr:hypothetical protein [Candidatus Sulfomarinibacteraceae bacterium]
MTRLPDVLRRSWLRRRRAGSAAPSEPPVFHVPLDPWLVLAGPLDPELDRIRVALRPHRRRLWTRRIVRRAWIAAAAVAVAELGLWTAARFVPLEAAPAIGAAIPVLGLAALAAAAIRARPTVGETAIGVDREGGLGDRVASALALAVAVPAASGPAGEDELAAVAADAPPPDQATEERRFVRRQRRDALGSLRLLPPDLFRPRFSRRPAAIAVMAMLVLAPVVLMANPQDAVIAQARAIREEANAQAVKLDRLADDLESRGTNPDDPRTRLADELRELARQLRENPGDLDSNLARLGAVEASLRSQLNPANEQRAASLTALSRGLSRAATGNEGANPDGDPEQAAEDLDQVGDELDG